MPPPYGPGPQQWGPQHGGQPQWVHRSGLHRSGRAANGLRRIDRPSGPPADGPRPQDGSRLVRAATSDGAPGTPSVRAAAVGRFCTLAAGTSTRCSTSGPSG